MLPNETDPKLDGVDLTGFSDNYWIGLSLLHTLFVKEHNAICDHLKGSLSDLGRRAAVPDRAARQLGADGEDPHRRVDAGDPRQPGARARRCTPTGTGSCRVGAPEVRPRRHRDDRRDRRLRAGAPRGAVLDHRGVRLGLPPASAAPRRLRDPRPPQRRSWSPRPTSSRSRATGRGRRSPSTAGRTSSTRSAIAHPGAITLHNHPRALAEPRAPQRRPRRPRHDRHPARPRARRPALQRLPREAAQAAGSRRSRTSPTTPSWREEIRDVYDGDIDRVDLQVGMLAEPLPPGLRLLRHGVPDLHPDGLAAAEESTASSPTTTRPTSTRPRACAGSRTTRWSTCCCAITPSSAPALDGCENAFAPWRRLGAERAGGAVSGIELPSASLLENARFNALVIVPNAVQGIFRRRRAAVAVATRGERRRPRGRPARRDEPRAPRRPGLGPRGAATGRCCCSPPPTSTGRSTARPTRSPPTRSPSATGWSPSSPTR